MAKYKQDKFQIIFYKKNNYYNYVLHTGDFILEYIRDVEILRPQN